ncbi:hypothetical protein [Siphonobacter aquaeclarae]|jgi:hypothetical protein|uniref:Uncharacterized protein n=1 Tax=Siphonobacter aquaeclarae TaxID=563176 RepID=A0A1G9RW59_9BACT|nr:hypothetical protein [Siphonobacter aquaeclarae]MBO9640382.1 hypothetical protein [Siphonobacter aquaeclarae]SDM27528.1 hypothetical protein SAMN04488090_3075 [Siphonobacter aquaeclarae]
MPSVENSGSSAPDIQKLKDDIRQGGKSFVYTEDPELDEPTGDEFAHFQFVGQHEGKETVFDAVVYTLRLHHSSLVYEEAERRATKEHPLYVPLDQRDETYQPNEEMDEEVELLITEIIEEIEENEEIKVTEHIETEVSDPNVVELDICLNKDAVTEDVIEQFVRDYNAGTLSLDPTLYSFKSLEEE